MKNICSIFVLLTILTVEIFSQSQQSKTIYGFISDSLTGEKLSYVTVTVEKSIVDIRSNQYSYYTVTTNEPLPIKIKFSRYGYNPLVIVVHDTNQTIQRNISLLSRTFEMPEVLVEGMSNEILLEKHSFGLSTMQIESFKKTPSIGGEMDILKGMQHLAGVLPGQEFSTELHIRGGEQSENTILLDDMPLYNVGHLFGFFSVFNGDVLQEVELFKGAIPANYGGKLSSVLRVTQKEGNKEKFKTQGGISMLTSRLFVEGPISDIGSFLLAGRRTYLDPVLEIAASNEADNFSLYFYDLNLKTNFTLSATDKIFISGYFGRDNLNMSDLNRLSQPDIYYQLVWGNAGYNVRYLKILSPQIFVSSSIIFSDYRSSFYFGDDDITHSTPSITDLIFSLQTDYFISATSTLQFGLSHTTHSFNFVNDFLKLSTNKKMQFLISSKETRGFVSITSYIDEVIRINLGMNVGYFSSGNYIETDPRLSLTYFLNPHQAVNISYTRMHQFIHLFASVDIFSPSNLYYPSTNIVPPENSHQWSLGYTSKFDNGFLGRGNYAFTNEIYYKTINQLPYFKYGSSSISNAEIQSDDVSLGIGLAYGEELSLQFENGRTTINAALTISRTMRKFDNRNNGEAFPANFDRLVQSNILYNYQINQNWNLGAEFVLATGQPFSIPQHLYRLGEFIIDYGRLNSYRSPIYNRLDISATYKFLWIGGSWDLFLSVYNVYNYPNRFFIRYYEGRSTMQSSSIGIIPTVGVNFKF